MGESLLSADGLGLAFERNVALADASVEVREGEIVALVGRSGSGKSTLLHCLAGLLVPDRGRVMYRDREVTGLGAEARARMRLTEFGFVLQFGQLVPELSAVQNAAVPLRLAGLSKREAERKAMGLLERLGVAELRASRPGELSGGEQQRVAIARALVHEPSVVFADEPTGALDAANGEAVAMLLREVARERGAAVIVATHDTDLASEADRSVRVEDGVTAAEVVRR
ncbi:ABC transporter ATP-binding protein [Demequina sp. NBRC 110054]|uniref:ABC transporter ATP-binding protein n=1 Tax=Demequina sp. NBRC 110054 TaxID=1570343 RepID=UPI000A021897|nr:ABC transporter ATP-binding protein [Demequina sp. NBRC 110054]